MSMWDLPKRLRRLLPQRQHSYYALTSSDSQRSTAMTSTQIDLIDYVAGQATTEAGQKEEISMSHDAQDKYNQEPGTIEKTSTSNSNGSIEGDPDAPSEEDFRTLRKVSGKIPWTAYTIAFRGAMRAIFLLWYNCDRICQENKY